MDVWHTSQQNLIQGKSHPFLNRIGSISINSLSSAHWCTLHKDLRNEFETRYHAGPGT